MKVEQPEPPVTIITTCMQRLEFLKRSLPTWVEYTDFPIVVVDYACPEFCGDWVEASEFSTRVRVTRIDAKTHQGRLVFNPSRARNTGAAAVQGGYLLFLDADVQVTEGFQEWVSANLRQDAMLAAIGKPSALFGFLGVHKHALVAAGGYDEGFQGWGGEDMDLRIRLHLLGLAGKAVPQGLLRNLAHSNSLRSKNSMEPNFTKARQMNGNYLDEKLVRLTGRKFSAWWSDPKVDCLGRR